MNDENNNHNTNNTNMTQNKRKNNATIDRKKILTKFTKDTNNDNDNGPSHNNI